MFDTTPFGVKMFKEVNMTDISLTHSLQNILDMCH